MGSRSSTLEQMEQAMNLSMSDAKWEDQMAKILKDFSDNRHGLLLVLPHEKEGLQKVEQEIFAKSYTPKDFIEKMNGHLLVELIMPRFSIRYKAEMINILVEMGIVDLPYKVDLSGEASSLAKNMKKKVEFYHESMFKVDEYGALASAASASLVFKCCGPPIDVETTTCELFALTHPFIFYLVDLANDSIPLFIGHIVDPCLTS